MFREIKNNIIEHLKGLKSSFQNTFLNLKKKTMEFKIFLMKNSFIQLHYY